MTHNSLLAQYFSVLGCFIKIKTAYKQMNILPLPQYRNIGCYYCACCYTVKHMLYWNLYYFIYFFFVFFFSYLNHCK